MPYERRSSCYKLLTFPFCFQPPFQWVETGETVQLFPGLNRLGRVDGLLPYLEPRLRMNVCVCVCVLFVTKSSLTLRLPD